MGFSRIFAGPTTSGFFSSENEHVFLLIGKNTWGGFGKTLIQWFTMANLMCLFFEGNLISNSHGIMKQMCEIISMTRSSNHLKKMASSYGPRMSLWRGLEKIS